MDWSLYAVTECDVHLQRAIVRMILWHNASSCYVAIACYFAHAILELRTENFLTFPCTMFLPVITPPVLMQCNCVKSALACVLRSHLHFPSIFWWCHISTGPDASFPRSIMSIQACILLIVCHFLVPKCLSFEECQDVRKSS